MFYRKNDDDFKRPMDGVSLKTLVYGDKTLLSEFRLEKGNILPEHTHPHEQTGYLVSGKIDLIIEGKKFEAKPGDSWCIAGDIPHGADILEDSIAIEVFSPVREEYLP